MNFPDLSLQEDACVISLDKCGRVLINITVHKSYFNREKFEKGNIPFASCWDTLPNYKTVACEIYKTVCNHMNAMNREFTRDDFKEIRFSDKLDKYSNAITSW